MPKRGKPEPPLLNYGGMGGLLGESGILEWDTSEQYHLSWQLPEDNGLPIDMFLLRYFPVSWSRHLTTWWIRTNSYHRCGTRWPRRAPGKEQGMWSLRRSQAQGPPATPSGHHLDLIPVWLTYYHRFPFSDTYVKIILQAHNEFGYSSEAVLVIRAIKGRWVMSLGKIWQISVQVKPGLLIMGLVGTSPLLSCRWSQSLAPWFVSSSFASSSLISHATK